MVTHNSERRASSEYSLERIHELARCGLVGYASRRVQLDLENYGYSHAEACRCVEALTSDCYQHSERYAAAGSWNDIYKLDWPAPTGNGIDRLYIQLRLRGDCCWIVLASFHPDR